MAIISQTRSFLYTLFLFTKTDFKRVYFQMLLFAAVTGPFKSIPHLVIAAFWAWSHLLEACITNQCMRPEEDRLNKPFRPIAAGRMSVETARLFRWVVLASNLGISAFLGPETLLPASVVFALYSLLYNDLGLDAHWIGRNVLNAVGSSAWFSGAILIAGGLKPFDAAAQRALILSFGITLTTYFVTDFDDLKGDEAVGRRTVPIIAPQLSRWAAMTLLAGWSVALVIAWDLPVVAAFGLCALALAAGGRLVSDRSEKGDHNACIAYIIWFAIVHLLPGYWRLQHSTSSNDIVSNFTTPTLVPDFRVVFS